jgi:hypothetical protein
LSNNKDRSTKDVGRDERSTSQNDDYRSTDLRDSPMMVHLMEAMKKGEDIGEYGRLTFTMVARHFIEDDEIVKLLKKQPEMSEINARALLLQVKERGYNPPKRERILQWMERQDFPICPNPEDPNGCNVYRDLQFPDEIYSQIDDFWEERAEAEE